MILAKWPIRRPIEALHQTLVLDAGEQPDCWGLHSGRSSVDARTSGCFKGNHKGLTAMVTGATISADAILRTSIVVEFASGRATRSTEFVRRDLPCDVGPNISGGFGFDDFISEQVPPYGAFSQSSTSKSGRSSQVGRSTYDLSLRASRSNSLYGSAVTVQPAAIRLQHCIKT